MKHLAGEWLRWAARQIDPPPHILFGDIHMAQTRYIAAVEGLSCAHRDLITATRQRAASV